MQAAATPYKLIAPNGRRRRAAQATAARTQLCRPSGCKGTWLRSCCSMDSTAAGPGTMHGALVHPHSKKKKAPSEQAADARPCRLQSLRHAGQHGSSETSQESNPCVSPHSQQQAYERATDARPWQLQLLQHAGLHGSSAGEEESNPCVSPHSQQRAYERATDARPWQLRSLQHAGQHGSSAGEEKSKPCVSPHPMS